MLLLAPVLLLSSTSRAQYGPFVELRFRSGSSRKREQIIGDVDWAVPSVKTQSQTLTYANVLGNGLGYSFEHNGKLIFLFGDTIGASSQYVPTYAPSVQPGLWKAHDPIASTSAQSATDPLVLSFFKNGSGTALEVDPVFPNGRHVNMGGNNIPASGISVNGNIYLVCTSGCKVVGGKGDYSHAFSVLTRFDPQAKAFHAIRRLSSLPGGHFVMTSPHLVGSDVYIFGVGEYRKSDIYLAKVPASSFESLKGIKYLHGPQRVLNQLPDWRPKLAMAEPVVRDPGSGGSAAPTIGNLSVAYCKQLQVWLMTFDGGRNVQGKAGIYFSYAASPTGPWSQPQLIFNTARDQVAPNFIRTFDSTTHQWAGPAGPTIGDQSTHPPTTTSGATFAPELVEPFTQLNGKVLTIYYTMSTWNPYTVVLMHSDFEAIPIKVMYDSRKPVNPRRKRPPGSARARRGTSPP